MSLIFPLSLLAFVTVAEAAPGDSLGTVNLVDSGNSTVGITFDGSFYLVPFGGSKIIDGLAYDAEADTLYFSQDKSCCVYRF